MNHAPPAAAPAPPVVATDEPLALRFMFGGRTWGVAHVAGRVLRTHATRLSSDAASAPPNFAELPDAVAAVQIPCCPVTAPLPALARVGGVLRYAPMQGVLRYTRLGATLDATMAALPAKGRHEVKRKSKRFAEAEPGARLVVARTPDEVRAFHAAARALSARTYQERVLKAGMPDGDAFVAELLRDAAQDRVRGYLLERDGRTFAYGYCRAYEDDVLCYEHTGYEPDAAAAQPGAALLFAMYGALAEEGRFRLLDFGFGDAQYKREASTDVLDVARVWWLRPGLGRTALVRAHRGTTVAADAAAAFVAKLGLKDRLRRLIRRAPR